MGDDQLVVQIGFLVHPLAQVVNFRFKVLNLLKLEGFSLLVQRLAGKGQVGQVGP